MLEKKPVANKPPGSSLLLKVIFILFPIQDREKALLGKGKSQLLPPETEQKEEAPRPHKGHGKAILSVESNVSDANILLDNMLQDIVRQKQVNNLLFLRISIFNCWKASNEPNLPFSPVFGVSMTQNPHNPIW